MTKHKHKKKFGQNFLEDKNYVERIIDVSDIKEDDVILEIGPGDGAMTKKLLEKAKKVICVELDRDLEKILRDQFDDNEKFNLIMKDVLKLDFKTEIGEKVKVVANIPYYITSPIINKLIENREYVDEIFIMVQKEVGERIVSPPDSKDYGILTIAVNFYADSTLLFVIPKEAFDPPPNVDSAFLSIKMRKNNRYEELITEEELFKYVKAAFASRRKNIVNNISSLGFEKGALKELFEQNGIEPNKRAENFSIDEFIEMISLLKK